MKSPLFFIYLSSIFFSAIVAFIYKNDLRRKGILILFPFVLFVLIQEVVLYVYGIEYPNENTSIIYNFYRIINVLVFSFLFYKMPFQRVIKRIILILVLLYLLLLIITFGFLQSVYDRNNYQATFSGLILTVYGFLTLFFYLNLDSSAEEKHWRYLIPLAIGLVTFYPVVNISQAFQDTLKNVIIADMKLYNIIAQVMSIFMYCCFARAFYLCQKKN